MGWCVWVFSFYIAFASLALWSPLFLKATRGKPSAGKQQRPISFVAGGCRGPFFRPDFLLRGRVGGEERGRERESLLFIRSEISVFQYLTLRTKDYRLQLAKDFSFFYQFICSCSLLFVYVRLHPCLAFAKISRYTRRHQCLRLSLFSLVKSSARPESISLLPFQFKPMKNISNLSLPISKRCPARLLTVLVALNERSSSQVSSRHQHYIFVRRINVKCQISISGRDDGAFNPS